MMVIVIGSNVATIFTVLGSVLKISSEFGSMKADTKNNSKRLDNHETRLLHVENRG